MSHQTASVYIQTAETVPATPAAVTLSGVTTTGLQVSWDAVTGATGYTLQRSLNGTTGWATVYNGSGTSHAEVELASSTTYFYRLSASNSAGSSGYSANASATTLTDVVVNPPGTPSGPPTASGTDSDSTVVTIAAVATATSYTLQRSTSPTTGFATVYNGSDLVFTNTGLAAATTYYYRYSASNSGGTSAYSTNLTVTTSSVNSTSVRPVPGRRIYRRTGIAAHPNVNDPTKVWTSNNAQEFCDLVAAAGFTHIRGRLPNGDTGPNGVAYKWATAMRAAGIGWLMIPTGEGTGGRPTDDLPSTTTATVRRIRDTYADICVGIEGLNEPNHVRSAPGVTAHPIDGWATDANYGAIAHQKAIWDAARDPLNDGSPNPLRNVPILAASLHDKAAQDSYTASETSSPSGGREHYHQIAQGKDANGVVSTRGGMNDANGNPRYYTHVGQHSYPGGSFPLRGTDQRLGYIYRAFTSNPPVWLTEHGWHNALNTTAGHVPIPEAQAGTYGIRGLLQHLSAVKNVGGSADTLRELVYTYYEGLDDSQSLTAHEERFGAWGVGSGTGTDRGSGSATDPVNPATWREKPVATKMAVLLNACKDPASVTTDYTPVNVTCSVTSSASNHNLQWQLTATKAQSDANVATLWVWRNMDVWNRETEQVISVGTVAVTVTDAQGARSFNVNAEVQKIDLRAPAT